MPEWIGARVWHILITLVLLGLLGPSPSPEPMREALREAAMAQEGGRPGSALAAVELALEFEPGDLNLHWQAARLAHAAGTPDVALNHLDAADRISPTVAERTCLRADSVLATGDPSAALALWGSLSSVCPDAVNQHRGLAAAYLATGDIVGYERALSQLVELAPGDREALRSLALAKAARVPTESVPLLRAMDQGSENGDPLARSLIRAIEEARLEGNPAYSLAQVGQVLAQHGEWLASTWALQRALELEPDYVEARAYLGMSLDRSGQDGLAELQAAAAAAPQSALPHAFLGLHWRSQGDASKALAELETAAQLNPTDPAIAGELGATYEALGDPQSALAAYLYATQLAPQEPGFWLLLAQFSLRQELQVQTIGLPAARNAATLAPNDPAALDALGYSYLLVGNASLAERILTRSLALAPDRPSSLYHLGLLKLKQGDLTSARQALQSVIDLDPGGNFADLAQRALERVDS